MVPGEKEQEQVERPGTAEQIRRLVSGIRFLAGHPGDERVIEAALVGVMDGEVGTGRQVYRGG